MIIRIKSKAISLLYFFSIALCCLPSLSAAATRLTSYEEALEKASSDGIIVYCYGADWHPRSIRMLDSFWRNNPALEAATGNAILLEAPYYQNLKSPKAIKAEELRGDMPQPTNQICPSVLMLDRKGRLYAELRAGDGLIEDKEAQLAEKLTRPTSNFKAYNPSNSQEAEEGKWGIHQIETKLALFRKQQELLKLAQTKTGTEAAALITQACELDIAPPADARDLLYRVTPNDEGGYLKRFSFDPRAFVEKELEIIDGMISREFVEDHITINRHVMEIVRDKQLRPQDRQKVFNLMIGAYKRAGYGGRLMMNYIRQSQILDKESLYGRAYINLMQRWGGQGTLLDKEARDKIKEERKEKEKAKRENQIRDRRSDGNFTIS